jgi:hypothetical protein
MKSGLFTSHYKFFDEALVARRQRAKNYTIGYRVWYLIVKLESSAYEFYASCLDVSPHWCIPPS